MGHETAKLALGRQVHALRDRLATDPKAPTYRDHLVGLLERLENVLSDENAGRQDLKRSAFSVSTIVTGDWSLGRSALGQELLVISGRVQKLGD